MKTSDDSLRGLMMDTEKEKMEMDRLPWLPDMAGFFLQRKILRRKIPLLASFKVTHRCNLECRACPFHLRTDEDNSRMSWDAAIAALENLRRLGTRLVV
ncbi:MAG TPA: hypothetical protein P5040_04880, partial [Smithella sp.]|nr:hypothetical protein [Smithella sp.]